MAKQDGLTVSHTYKYLNANRPKPMHNPSPLRNIITADNAFSDIESCLGGSNDECD